MSDDAGMVCTNCGHAQLISQKLALLHDGVFIQLPNPGAPDALQRLGFTWTGAVADGRLVVISPSVCQECMSITDRRVLIRPQLPRVEIKTGTRAAKIAACSTFALILYPALVNDWPGWAVALVCVIPMVIVDAIAGSVQKRRIRRDHAHLQDEFLNRSEVIDISICRRCCGTRLADYREFLRSHGDTALLCPNCGERALQRD